MPIANTKLGQIETLTRGEASNVQQFFLFHASATGPHSLMPLAGRLEGNNWQIVIPGFDGYAGTKLNRSAGTDPMIRNTLIANQVMKDSQGDKRVMFGHSMGGLVALLSALDQHDNDNAPDAIILFDPILHDVLDLSASQDREALDWDQAIIKAMGDDIRGGEPEKGVSRFVEAWNEVNWESMPEKVRMGLVASAERLHSEAAALPARTIKNRVPDGFGVPTLLLVGQNSPAFCHLAAKRATALLPGSKMTVLDGLGHMGPIASPDTIAEAIERFLNETDTL